MDVDDLFPEGDDIPGSGGRSESGDIPEGNDGAVGTDDADTPRDIPGANINTGRGQDHAASGCTNKTTQISGNFTWPIECGRARCRGQETGKNSVFSDKFLEVYEPHTVSVVDASVRTSVMPSSPQTWEERPPHHTSAIMVYEPPEMVNASSVDVGISNVLNYGGQVPLIDTQELDVGFVENVGGDWFEELAKRDS
ncbi:hypothetical protein JRO89_XS04G0068800 [Xanthoceras sorbifolium]|uniref:Uncharacterized protein n=1 Tax=Xanthoceras sorbifolium TaxID=99658 RepID=A0ABQ8I4G1_9ROSI|nr:hypothetical protein JRO89_XS04G0068800 [Xanthoceras sorbifolium]